MALASNAQADGQEGGAMLPRCVAQEVLADRSCPLHLRLQLSRALAPKSCCQPDASTSVAGTSRVGVAAMLTDSGCTALMAAFLPHKDILAARAVDVALLCDVMQRQPGQDEEKRAYTPAFAVARGTDSAGEDSAETSGVTLPSALSKVHNRIRARLWLHRLGDVTAGAPDESVFETSVRSFVDEALRRRLESEVMAAKLRMEEEVREAKTTMLQCVQAVSEEVDRRVRDKVASLQAELDRRTSDQARDLRDLVERRVSEQTTALQAEVDRRTDSMRAAMEHRARQQETAALQLREEVVQTRAILEVRVVEQEAAALRLLLELTDLRKRLLELAGIREILERRVADQEHLTTCLRAELAAAVGAGDRPPIVRSPIETSAQNHSRGLGSSCWTGISSCLGTAAGRGSASRVATSVSSK